MLPLQDHFQIQWCKDITSIKIHGLNQGRLLHDLLKEAENNTDVNTLPSIARCTMYALLIMKDNDVHSILFLVHTCMFIPQVFIGINFHATILPYEKAKVRSSWKYLASYMVYSYV